MKRSILIGSLISAILLLLTPHLAAMQFSVATTSQEQQIQEHIQQTMFPSSILTETQQNTLTHRFLTLITTILSSDQFTNLKNQLQANNNDDPGPPEPLFFPFLGIFVYGLIAYILLRFVGTIFRNIGFIFSGIIGTIINGIKGVITLILTIITVIITTIISLLTGIVNMLTKIAGFLLNTIVLILSAILSIIIMILTGLFRLLERLWGRIGNFFGFLLDVLRLIYNIIFPSAI